MNINFNYYLKNPRNMTILIYLFIVIFIVIIKPTIMFDNNYKVKKLGFGENNTFLPYYLFSIIIAILIYYIVNLYYVNLVNF